MTDQNQSAMPEPLRLPRPESIRSAVTIPESLKALMARQMEPAALLETEQPQPVMEELVLTVDVETGVVHKIQKIDAATGQRHAVDESGHKSIYEHLKYSAAYWKGVNDVMASIPPVPSSLPASSSDHAQASEPQKTQQSNQDSTEEKAVIEAALACYQGITDAMNAVQYFGAGVENSAEETTPEIPADDGANSEDQPGSEDPKMAAYHQGLAMVAAALGQASAFYQNQPAVPEPDPVELAYYQGMKDAAAALGR